ncbi:hypothetical protein C8R44DRAFT_992469 [Mycena epipterygia]|nr:hypothetical protein C8R44DRAFT_992469 [Mycena epipterygia]
MTSRFRTSTLWRARSAMPEELYDDAKHSADRPEYTSIEPSFVPHNASVVTEELDHHGCFVSRPQMITACPCGRWRGAVRAPIRSCASHIDQSLVYFHRAPPHCGSVVIRGSITVSTDDVRVSERADLRAATWLRGLFEVVVPLQALARRRSSRAEVLRAALLVLVLRVARALARGICALYIFRLSRREPAHLQTILRAPLLRPSSSTICHRDIDANELFDLRAPSELHWSRAPDPCSVPLPPMRMHGTLDSDGERLRFCAIYERPSRMRSEEAAPNPAGTLDLHLVRDECHLRSSSPLRSFSSLRP